MGDGGATPPPHAPRAENARRNGIGLVKDIRRVDIMPVPDPVLLCAVHVAWGLPNII